MPSSARRLFLVGVLAASACASRAPAEAPAPSSKNIAGGVKGTTITLAHGSPSEQATKAQLERLLANADVDRWLLTRTIVIDEEAIPHSHPVLTLHTRHLKDDDQLLSTFLHEQLHWQMIASRDATERAVVELRLRFPSLPVGYPDGSGGSACSAGRPPENETDSDRMNYVHLPIIYLEYEGLKGFVGEERAKRTFAFWEGDHYRALYRLVREHMDEIASVSARSGVVPAFANVKPSTWKPPRRFEDGDDAALANVTPESIAIDRLIDAAEATHSDSLLVIKDKKVIVERYFGQKREPIGDGEPHRIETMSVTKSFASLAIGFLLADKKIPSLDAPLSRWFPDFAKDPKKAKITLRHVLTHTTGIDHKPTATVMNHAEDRLAYVRALPVVDEPGTRFSYNNEATQLLSEVIAKSAGKPIDVYLDEKLFKPLGIRDWSWEKDKKGNVETYAGLALGARDLAKIGEMLLARGRYEDREILPESWVATSTGPSRPDMSWIGLLWWVENEGPYFVQSEKSLKSYAPSLDPAIATKLAPLHARKLETRAAYWIEAGALLSASERAAFLANLRDDRSPFAIEPAKPVGFRADGWLGQYLVVFPDQGVVAVRQHRMPSNVTDEENEKNGFHSFARLVRAVGSAPAR